MLSRTRWFPLCSGLYVFRLVRDPAGHLFPAFHVEPDLLIERAPRIQDFEKLYHDGGIQLQERFPGASIFCLKSIGLCLLCSCESS